MRPSKCRSPIRRPLGTSPCRDEDRLRQLRVWDSRKMAPLFRWHHFSATFSHTTSRKMVPPCGRKMVPPTRWHHFSATVLHTTSRKMVPLLCEVAAAGRGPLPVCSLAEDPA